MENSIFFLAFPYKTNHDNYLALVPGVQSPSTRCTPPSQSSPGAAPRSSRRPPPPPPPPGTWCWHRSSDHPEHCDSVSCSRSTSPSSLATRTHVETWNSGSQGSSFFWQAWNIDLCPACLTSTLSPGKLCKYQMLMKYVKIHFDSDTQNIKLVQFNSNWQNHVSTTTIKTQVWLNRRVVKNIFYTQMMKSVSVHWWPEPDWERHLSSNNLVWSLGLTFSNTTMIIVWTTCR